MSTRYPTRLELLADRLDVPRPSVIHYAATICAGMGPTGSHPNNAEFAVDRLEALAEELLKEVRPPARPPQKVGR